MQLFATINIANIFFPVTACKIIKNSMAIAKLSHIDNYLQRLPLRKKSKMVKIKSVLPS